MNKNIFNNYNDVEIAFNNDLRAFYPNAKTMKARTLKGSGYYFKSSKTGKKYDISAEECRILHLFFNTLNALDKAQRADNMMSYYNGNVWWFERAELRRKAIEMINAYIDAFEEWLNEKNDETAEEVEAISEDEVEDEDEAETTSESETSNTEDIDVDRLIRQLRLSGVISDEDKIVVNEDESGIDVDIYQNGRWCTNIVLYEYD